MNELTIITGAGTGIGKALAIELAAKNEMEVLITGRRKAPLKVTADINPAKIKFCPADVGTESGRKKIVNQIGDNVTVKFLIHNAAVLTPVKSIKNIKLEEWRKHQAINVEGPLFLTQSLIKKMNQSRILHISSGAAHRALAGWAAYCTSKAALFMLYQVLNTELKQKNILVGSVRPGVVNTPMQTILRQSDPKAFPDLPLFNQYKDEGKLIPGKMVARFLSDILLNTSDEDFIEQEWDIYRDYAELEEKYKR